MAAELICSAAKQSVESCGAFTLVLAGGKTPGPLYEVLADSRCSSHMPWTNIHLFWGDERWVPLNHPDSNFNMATKRLLAHIDIPAANLHPIRTDLRTPEDAATAYEKDLQDYFRNAPAAKSGFDMVLLGMGTDGHTASLFPGSPALDITDRLVAAVRAPDASPAVDRITLTLPALNRASDVLFFISGQRKMDIMQSILAKRKASAQLYPAARVRARKRLLWLATPG
jgi:6-phosphogluconolactonase